MSDSQTRCCVYHSSAVCDPTVYQPCCDGCPSRRPTPPSQLPVAPTPGSNEAHVPTMVERIADSIPTELTATPHVGIGGARRLKIAHAVIPVVEDELREVKARLAELENALTWQTTCLACSRVLDSSYAETMRREQVEAANERVKVLALKAKADIALEQTPGSTVLADELDPDAVLAALTPRDREFAGPGGNAEDCPVCSRRRDIPYPFICQCPAAAPEGDLP